MSKLEAKIEGRMTKDSLTPRLGFLASSFIRHPSFVLRHFTEIR